VSNKNEREWHELYKRRIFFTVRSSPDVLYGYSVGASSSENLLASRGLTLERARELISRIDPAWFPHGAVLDIEFLNRLALRGDEGEAADLFRSHAELARVRLQGTDGLRGKATYADLRYSEALGLFVREGAVTPAFLGLSAKALGMECLENDLIARGEDVVVGTDGRDTSGRFVEAVARAFNELGLGVLDAGVLATPGVPVFARYAGCKIGAIVTASHNPSNQNGIKYVYDGFKLPNDGPVGEFGLTAYMYRLADRDEPARATPQVVDVHEEATELLYRVDMENAGVKPRQLENLRLVYDGANGAYGPIAMRVLTDLGADFVAINVDSRGYNINQGGGVGEIEGHAFFEGRAEPNAYSSYLPTVRTLFDEGRAAGGRRIFGIVNDGDGDRGYLLVYSPGYDRVCVVPGDEIAFWIARGRRDEGSLGVKPVCVSSVESDILAGHYMTSILGIENETACVGDKNLLKPAREGRNHIVGCEESGHVTFGLDIKDREGKNRTVYTGNGLLSVLRAIAVIQECGASLEEVVHPFPGGKKDCRYVYFVDKTRFYPGSEVWREDELLALDLMQTTKPAGYSVRALLFPDDPQMLYLACFNPEGVKEGALFVRNSGTEMKTSVTIRCTRALYPMMRQAMLSVHRRNSELMKDRCSRDAIIEGQILATLGSGPLSPAETRVGVEKRLGETVTDTDFSAILFAMRKEGVVRDCGEVIALSGE